MDKKFIVFLKCAIYFIGLIVFGLCVFWLPMMANEAAALEPKLAYLKYPVLIGLYMTAIPFFYALYQTIRLLNLINQEHAFSKNAILSLKGVKLSAIFIVIIYIIGLVFLGSQSALHPGIALMGLTIVFTSILIAVFTAVLQELFRSALEIKIENDLTV